MSVISERDRENIEMIMANIRVLVETAYVHGKSTGYEEASIKALKLIGAPECMTRTADSESVTGPGSNTR